MLKVSPGERPAGRAGRSAFNRCRLPAYYFLTLIFRVAVALLPERSIASTCRVTVNFFALPIRLFFGFSLPVRVSVEKSNDREARTRSPFAEIVAFFAFAPSVRSIWLSSFGSTLNLTPPKSFFRDTCLGTPLMLSAGGVRSSAGGVGGAGG